MSNRKAMATKTAVATEKAEIVQQIRLTSKQRLTLVSMGNNGGKSARMGIDWGVRQDLQALGLIEERAAMSPAEKQRYLTEIDDTWRKISAIVKAKNIDDLSRAVDYIQARNRDLESVSWWLTPAAKEYLTKGRVVITR